MAQAWGRSGNSSTIGVSVSKSDFALDRRIVQKAPLDDKISKSNLIVLVKFPEILLVFAQFFFKSEILRKN